MPRDRRRERRVDERTASALAYESGCASDGAGSLRPAEGGSLIALCPSGGVSGGPELLHQLVAQTREAGVSAGVSYYPSWGERQVPAPYRRYVAESVTADDDERNVIVAPEVATGLLRNFPRARKVVWWLSFDNYFTSFHCKPDTPVVIQWIRRLLQTLGGLGRPMGWRELRTQCVHLSQSNYASERLAARGIPSAELSDYLSAEYLSVEPPPTRSQYVAYNPRKGLEVTRRVIAANPQLDFRAIEGLDAAGVVRLLSTCAVYIDFGHHPGKDRLPREAALCGACIVTGMRGSAGDARDVPIPERYRLDERSPDFLSKVNALLREICAAPGQHVGAFDGYRQAIREEPERFRARLSHLLAAGRQKSVPVVAPAGKGAASQGGPRKGPGDGI